MSEILEFANQFGLIGAAFIVMLYVSIQRAREDGTFLRTKIIEISEKMYEISTKVIDIVKELLEKINQMLAENTEYAKKNSEIKEEILLEIRNMKRRQIAIAKKLEITFED